MRRSIFFFVVLNLTLFSFAAAQKPVSEVRRLAAALPKVVAPVFSRQTFTLTSFGAVGDGLTDNSAAFARAIDAAHKARGTVIVPAGVWLTGPIELKSNVRLHLESQALIIFSSDRSLYPLVATTFEGVAAFRAKAPISATNAANIAITGRGIIDGSGEAWRPVKRGKMTESAWKELVASGGKLTPDGNTWYPSESALAGTQVKDAGKMSAGRTRAEVEAIKDFLRPNMVQINNSRNILMEGVTFQNSPAWTLHFIVSEHITIRRVNVKNPWYGQNNDAVDLESSRNALLEDCIFDTGDDAITLKSGRDEEGRRRGIPTENVLARNMTIYRGHGAFVIGSEMSGGVRNVFVLDSTFIGTDVGLRFKTQRGRGGLVSKVYAEGIRMKDIAGDAILFDMYYGGRVANTGAVPVTEATPRFEDFLIRDVVVSGAKRGVFLRGLPEMNVRNVRFENLTIESDIGVDAEEVADISFTNATILSRRTNPVISVVGGGLLTFDNLKYTPGASFLVSLARTTADKVRILNTDESKAETVHREADITFRNF